LIAYATGENPWTGPEGETERPITAWVICASWSQSLTIQEKIWEKLPKDKLHPSCVYDEANGFSPTKAPVIRVRHRRGGYSTVRIKTMDQGGLRLSSATIDYVWFDEPPKSPRVYTEVTKRVLRAGRNGRIVLTMTPINAPVEWLQEAVEKGTIEDHHARMEPAEFTLMRRGPRGGWEATTEAVLLRDGTPADATWIQASIADTLPYEVPVVCHGEWKMAADSPIFTAFRPEHVSVEAPPTDATLALGIDFGVRVFSQTGILLAWNADEEDMRLWILDEYVGEHETTEDDDAAGLLDMLERSDLVWSELDHVHADKAFTVGAGKRTITLKSAERLARALTREPRARAHGITRGVVPAIRPAKRGITAKAGSVEFGCTFLHRLMVANRLRIHPRCERTIAAIQNYDMTPNSDESHYIDGIRYGAKPLIWRGVRVLTRGELYVR
jgi:phage terminase large subunit-like protein